MYNVEKLGKYYFEKLGHEDYVLWLCMLRQGRMALNQGECLASHRIHNKSLSVNKSQVIRWQWKIYREIEKLNLLSSCIYFLHYAWNGIKKRI